jgi:hypothetical protein
MFASRAIEKNRKPSKFRDNKEKDAKIAKKQKPYRESQRREDTNDYQQGC